MGTDIVLLIPSHVFVNNSIISESKKIFCDMEEKFSRFRSTSLLTKLNTEKKLKIDDDFLKVFLCCKIMYQQTHGAFNPLLSVKKLGYEKSFQSPSAVQKEKYNTDFESIVIQDNMLVLQNDQELDLGGIVKGWTVDTVSQFLVQNGIHNFLLNAGGDIFAAGKASENEKWRVAIENSGQVMELQNQAVATSGKNRRNWKGSDGKHYHHILNYLSKDSAENDLESITVLANTCAEADAFATAAFSLGRVEGQNLLIERKIPYFLKFDTDSNT